MNKILMTLAAAVAALRLGAAEPVTVELYPDSLPGVVMYVYPADKGDGTAIVSCPGGAYALRAMGHEGHEFAPWLNDHGISYAVVEYRLPEGRHEVPSADVEQAIRIMRSHADEWGASRVGVMGFSAGGHLASTVATHARGEARPDFQILFYPVITMNPSFTHHVTHDKLLGDNATPQLEQLYSNELQVTRDTPPALILSTWDDDCVPVKNTIAYAQSLSAADVPAAVYIFPTGGHGWGFHDTYAYKPLWQQLFLDWLGKL